ncbi:MAG: acylphosphatase [Alphaproteobacteria bacterium]
MAEIARHVRVTGRVQGVFYRAWTQDQARKLGLKGWVRNCPDGRVEAHVEGEEAAVSEMVERMRDGPLAAEVQDLRTWDVECCDFDGFEVRR